MPPHKHLEHLYLFIVLALLAEILGTIGGFGSSLFFVPIAGYFLDFHEVLGITAVFHVSSNLSKLYFFRSGIDKRLIVQMGIPAVAAVLIGGMLSTQVSGTILEICLACFMIVLSIWMLKVRSFQLQPTALNAFGGGAISGFLAGLLGTGGAIRGLSLAAFSLPKDVFIATSACIDLGVDFSRSIVYLLNGYVKSTDVYLIAVLIVVSFAGTYIGKIILQQIPEERFRTLVLWLIMLTGVMTLWRFLFPN